MTPEEQILFCRLIKYFHHGDYATFKRVCEMAYPQLVTDRYFFANCFLSSHIAGLIEVSEAERSTWWWASFDGDIEINSAIPKLIGTTKTWALLNSANSVPLVTDRDGRALLCGQRDFVAARTRGTYDHGFLRRFPSFLEAESDILVSESFRLDLGKYIEVYSTNEEKWNIAEQGDLNGAYLIRARKEFSGLTYYIINSELGLLFRLLHPEWAFISAMNLLNWPLESLIFESGQNTRIPRAVRLPAPLLRYLFASSERCQIGTSIEFIGIEKLAWDALRSYLSPWGRKYAAESH